MSVEAQKAETQGGLSGAYVRTTNDRALEILQEFYGVSGALARFDTEKDDTFRVKTDQGAFVLKVANPDETPVEIDFQNSILKHIAEKDPSLPVPRLKQTSDGCDTGKITDIDGATRLVRLLTYLDGMPLDRTQSNPDERVQIGHVLARLRHAMADFSHPGEARCYPWDVQHLLLQAPLLDEVKEPVKRTALERGLQRFREIEPRLRACRQQVLHNDFSKSNIVVDHGDPNFVKGIIDFGDAVRTAVAIDVATALLNQLPETPNNDLFYRGRDILTGYLEMAELTEEELLLIPHLVMARVVVRALLTIWRAKLFPDNKTYILRNTEQGWRQLDWFLSRSIDEVSQTLMSFSDRTGWKS